MKAWLWTAWLVILQLASAIGMAAAQDSSRTACCLPLRRLTVTSGFGARTHPVTGLWQFHNGVDLRAHEDTVFAVMDGTVSQTGYDHLLGMYIRVAHAANITSVYGHLSIPWVITGQTVMAGQPVGLSGNSGVTTGEHLHFSIIYRGQYIDPLKFLSTIFQEQ